MVGIGFFAPFPLALMIPFMAGQSLAMGEAFGKGFQYGKRKISSMSNEEFNALDFKQLSESIATDYRVMIPSMKKSLEASDELQRAVFDALGKIILTLPDAVAGMFSDVPNRANLEATDETSLTSFSQQGELTEVRAGSGLGDIRKQQEQALRNQQEGAGAVTQLAKANRLAQEARDARARDQRIKDEIRTKAAQIALQKQVAVTGVVSTARKAGQSQIIERKQLITDIVSKSLQVQTAINRYKAPLDKNYGSSAKEVRRKLMNGLKGELVKLQAKLVILLQRYRF